MTFEDWLTEYTVFRVKQQIYRVVKVIFVVADVAPQTREAPFWAYIFISTLLEYEPIVPE